MGMCACTGDEVKSDSITLDVGQQEVCLVDRIHFSLAQPQTSVKPEEDSEPLEKPIPDQTDAKRELNDSSLVYQSEVCSPANVAIKNVICIFQARQEIRKLLSAIDISEPSISVLEVTQERDIQGISLLSPQAQITIGHLQPLQFTFTVKGVSYYSAKTLADGSVFEGQWVIHSSGSLVRKGKGRLYHIDGSLWEGYWKGGKIHLFGRIIYSTGDYYEGQLRAGLRTGSGVFESFDRKKRYTGEWKDDMKQGLGEELYADGALYRGEFANNVKQGKGEMTWVDGSLYTGDFFDGKIHGYGEFHWKDGRVYKGQWKDGKMHGKGECQYADGKTYSGSYADDKRHGWGVYHWEGKTYEGPWLAGKMHGRGYLTTPEHGRKCYEFTSNRRGEEVLESE